MTIRRLDLRLYLVTGPAPDDDTTVATVEAAVAGGVTAVQVRDPAATTRQLVATTRRLVASLAGTGVAVIVNDRLDVALAAGAAGVHVGQSDLHPLDARRLAGPELTVGWSITDPDQAGELAGWPDGTVDYLGVGPVHPTGSKADAAGALGYAGLAQVRDRSSLPMVGIGGIDVRHVRACLAAGADGVALISAIWSAPDPEGVARLLRAEIDRR